MSQHKFEIKRGEHVVRVLAGWDRPLQYLFLTIDKELVLPADFDSLSEEVQAKWLDRLENESEMLFSNLVTPIDSVEEIGKIMADHGIPIPLQFLENIAEDEDANAGNKVVVYSVEDAG